MAREPLSTTDHQQFDSLCEGVEEYDALPTPQREREWITRPDEESDERLDDQILAALVSPY